MSTPAQRQRVYRLRQATGEAVLKVSVDYDAMVLALLNSNRLTEPEALDRRLVETAVAAVLHEWASRWRE